VNTESEKLGFSSFLWFFLLTGGIASFPSKYIYYAAAPVLLFLVVRKCGLRSLDVRGVTVASVVLVFSLLSLLFHDFLGDEVSLKSYAAALLTYAPWLILIVLPFNVLAVRTSDIFRLRTVVSLFLVFQSLIGIVQYFLTKNSDAVTGTFGLGQSVTISQVLWAFTTICLLFFLLYLPKRLLEYVSILISLCALVLSYSGHATLFMLIVLSTAPAVLAVSKSIRIERFLKIALPALVIAWSTWVGMSIFAPSFVANVEMWEQKTTSNPNSLKNRFVDNSREVLSNPLNSLLGAGLGQYSGRAAQLFLLEDDELALKANAQPGSDYYRKYQSDLMSEFSKKGEGSAISKPFFSWLSALVELGFPGFALILGFLVLKLSRIFAVNVHGMRGASIVFSLRLFVGACLLQLALCSFVENYFEFTQALFIPLTIIFVAASYIARFEASEGDWAEIDGDDGIDAMKRLPDGYPT
jgi:hypothetical protein